VGLLSIDDNQVTVAIASECAPASLGVTSWCAENTMLPPGIPEEVQASRTWSDRNAFTGIAVKLSRCDSAQHLSRETMDKELPIRESSEVYHSSSTVNQINHPDQSS